MREPITVGGHLRIRPFNTADSYPEQRLDNDLCQAVVAGDTVYLTDIRHREPVYRVLGRRLKGVYPVFTGLVVSALARPEWLVEVTVVAVRP